MSTHEQAGTSADMSVADLVRSIQAEKKLSRAEIADEIGRSPRMVGKLLNGESKGESFREALTSLRDKGAVDRRPPRRRDSHGEIVAVRAKIDAEHQPQVSADGKKTKAPTMVPEDSGGRWTKKAPNRFGTKNSFADNGDRIYGVTMHKTNKKSRERAVETMVKNLRTVTRSQAKEDKRVSFTATLDNGRIVSIGEKGGYFSSDVLNRIKSEFGGDANAFIMDQIAKVYPPDGSTDHKITGLNMSVFKAKGQAQHSKKKR